LSTAFVLLRVASKQKPVNLSADRLTFFLGTSFVAVGFIKSDGEAILTRTSSVVNQTFEAGVGIEAGGTLEATADALACAARLA
jgi:hypothetical protein